MSNKRDVLESFKFKRVQYYKGGKVLESKFTELELSVLEQMGNLSPSSLKEAVKPKKEKKKKNADKA